MTCFIKSNMKKFIPNVMSIKIISEIFYMKSGFYTYRTSQFRLATFQELSSHMWLTATLLDCSGLEFISASSRHN